MFSQPTAHAIHLVSHGDGRRRQGNGHTERSETKQAAKGWPVSVGVRTPSNCSLHEKHPCKWNVPLAVAAPTFSFPTRGSGCCQLSQCAVGCIPRPLLAMWMASPASTSSNPWNASPHSSVVVAKNQALRPERAHHTLARVGVWSRNATTATTLTPCQTFSWSCPGTFCAKRSLPRTGIGRGWRGPAASQGYRFLIRVKAPCASYRHPFKTSVVANLMWCAEYHRDQKIAKLINYF